MTRFRNWAGRVWRRFADHPWCDILRMGLLIGIFVGVLYLDKTTATSSSQRRLQELTQQNHKLGDQNHDLAMQNQRVLGILQADDAIIRDATTPGGVINARGNDATTAAVDKLIVCIENHVDVLLIHKQPVAGCPNPNP